MANSRQGAHSVRRPESGRTDGQTRWFLEHASVNSSPWLVAIEPIPFTIGRDRECNLTVPSRWVSRRHAEIRTSGDLLWIRDLGSTNGTFVNHRQIQDSELLSAGDLLSFGETEFRIGSIGAVAGALDQQTSVMFPSEELARMAALEPRLQRVLHERAVIPHFQPILRFADMEVIGYEILGRIGDEELASSASELFHVADCLGCTSELSSLFREAGVGAGQLLPGSPLLFANSSPTEMHHIGGLLESLERVRGTGSSNRIVLEISEKAILDVHEMERLRDRLSALNIGLAFDDFGVGQVRLAELAKVPPDFLKFDISLIHNIHLAPKRLHQMVRTFVDAAQDLGISTLAEGIESSEEGETCRELGFEFAQGYLYGKPMPFGELQASLQ